MATAISIQIGAITASRNFTNDAKAATILSEFYLAQQLGPTGASNQVKLQAIVDWLVREIQEQAKSRAVKVAGDAAQVTADTDMILQ